MPTNTTILLAPALAPLTGDGAMSCATRDLARALQQNGWAVTLVVGLDSSVETNLVGLARRLEPIAISNADGSESDFIVHEGNIDGADISLLAVTADPKPTPTQCLQVALSLAETPKLVQFWSKTQSALPFLETLSPAPLSIVHLSNARSGEGLEAADLLLLRSEVAAHQERHDKKSALAAHASKLHALAPGSNDREWNPGRDSVLVRRLDPPTTAGKREAKSALRAELGLADTDVPMIGFVTDFPRLSRSLAEDLLRLPVQFVGIEAGPHVEAMATRAPLKASCPQPLSAYEQRQLRHRLVAAADFVVMPSPPGSGDRGAVSQLFPCRYGTAVIAPMKGEFADRLVNFDQRTRTGSGFLYREEHELLDAVRQAVTAWQAGEETRSALIERCLELDLSWTTVALRLDELVAPLFART